MMDLSGPASPTTPPAPTLTQSSPRIHHHNADNLSDIAKEQNQRFARDVQWKVVGPMPLQNFLEEFLPLQSRIPQFNGVKFAKVPDRPGKESEIYAPLRDELNKVLEKAGNGLAFYDTSNRPEEPGKVGTSKPDLGMFHEDDKNKGNMKDSHRRVKGSHPEEYIYTAYMGQVYMFVEVKTTDSLDFFTDPPPGGAPDGFRFTVDTGPKPSNDKKGLYRVQALGQSARYAHVVQTRQFRTCAYSISVAGTTARLLRWDRSGLIVTESFNYKENPSYLTSFIWRFSKSNDDKLRGWDLSAVSVDSESERSQFAAAIEKNVQEQIPGLSVEGIKREADRHYFPGAITRLTIGAGRFWVSRPIFTSKSPTGRSTVGYWGVDCKSKEVVFIKDIWRTDVPGVETEGVILEELRRVKVRNVPELVCHGDVVYGDAVQGTRTDGFANEGWVASSHPEGERHRPIRRVHYRLVTRGAGFRLSDFRGSRELLSATYDVFTAVMDAHSKANRLHRDISLGNIILLRLPGKEIRVGYLIDWELSCKTDRVAVRNHVLTGTPAFMSIAASKTTGTPHMHKLGDDLESMIYVVLYCALLWLPVTSLSKLDWWLTEFFGAPDPDRGRGAPFKTLNAVQRFYTSDLATTRSQAVLDWLNAAMDLHYCPMGSGIYGPNPDWDNGEALKRMWEETLAKELPSDDRHENPIPNIVLREAHSLHATHTSRTTSTSLWNNFLSPPATSSSRASSKRSVPASLGGDNSPGPSNSPPNKRHRQEGQHDVESDSVSQSEVPRRSTRSTSAKGKSGGTTAGGSGRRK